LLLCWILVPKETGRVLPWILQKAATILPTTYIVEAARISASFTTGLGRDIMIILYSLGALIIIYNILSIYAIGLGEAATRRRGVL